MNIQQALEKGIFRGNVSTIHGDVDNIRGNVSNIHGDVSNIHGDVSGIHGDVSVIRGDVSKLVCIRIQDYTAIFHEGGLIIGCESHPLSWWEENYKQFDFHDAYPEFIRVILPIIKKGGL